MTKELPFIETLEVRVSPKRSAFDLSSENALAALVTLIAQQAAEGDYAAFLRKTRDKNKNESSLP